MDAIKQPSESSRLGRVLLSMSEGPFKIELIPDHPNGVRYECTARVLAPRLWDWFETLTAKELDRLRPFIYGKRKFDKNGKLIAITNARVKGRMVYERVEE
jgi:hypothetical protein